MISLDEFAADKKAGCGVCRLPPEVRDQVDATLTAGSAGPTIIGKWLREECGFAITSRAVKHHQESVHHIHTAEILEGS